MVIVRNTLLASEQLGSGVASCSYMTTPKSGVSMGRAKWHLPGILSGAAAPGIDVLC